MVDFDESVIVCLACLGTTMDVISRKLHSDASSSHVPHGFFVPTK